MKNIFHCWAFLGTWNILLDIHKFRMKKHCVFMDYSELNLHLCEFDIFQFDHIYSLKCINSSQLRSFICSTFKNRKLSEKQFGFFIRNQCWPLKFLSLDAAICWTKLILSDRRHFQWLLISSFTSFILLKYSLQSLFHFNLINISFHLCTVYTSALQI